MKNSKITNTSFQYQGKPYAISMCGFNSLENENWEKHKYSNGEGTKSVRDDGKKVEKAMLITVMTRLVFLKKHG